MMVLRRWQGIVSCLVVSDEPKYLVDGAAVFIHLDSHPVICSATYIQGAQPGCLSSC